MDGPPLSPEDAMRLAAFVVTLLRQIDPGALPYATLALVAAFWHRHLWAVYLALALLMLAGWHG